MISFIICSRKKSDFDALAENIGQTIGVPFELIRIDNNTNKYSICQAYNVGAAQSVFDYFCFVHEDVKFVTQNWGHIVANLLKDEAIGLVGVAGGKYKSKQVGLAYNSTSKENLRINILQHTPTGTRLDFHNPYNLRNEEVVSVDGVFLACRKEVWEQNKFDEYTLKGFHFYDMDFALQIGGKYKVIVTYEILIEHFSMGKIDASWYKQALLAHQKWGHLLPKTIGKRSGTDLAELEYENATFVFFFLVENKFPKNQKIKQLLVILKLKPFKMYNINLLSLALKD
jgi:hypothetical protein